MSATTDIVQAPSKRLVAACTLALIVGFWAFGFPALDRYNITWDEALGDLFWGERYLSFFTSFDPVYLDPEARPYPDDRQPDLSLSPFKIRPWEYYPVANTLAAATAAVLARGLGWLDVFDGFHAVNLLLLALWLAVTVPFVARRWGLVAAVAGGTLLITQPRVFGHVMANIKDVPLTVFYGLTLLAFLHAYERGSKRLLLASGVLWGLALGSKANALFLPAIPGLVVLADMARRSLPAGWTVRSVIAWLAGTLTVGVGTMVAVWPYLWADPIGRFGQHLSYIGLRKGYTRVESMAPVLDAIVLTTPIWVLALAVLGTVVAVRRAIAGDRLALLVLVWSPVVLGRYLLPAAVNFDGVRHFLEMFPALALLAGLGAASAIRFLVDRLPSHDPRRLKAALLVLALVPTTVATLRAHPFQLTYWNDLTGGFAGAYGRGLPQASDYWGTSYRLGLEWLNEHAPEGALLAVPVVEHAVRLVASERLRPDITLLPITTPYTPRIQARRLAWLRQDSLQKPVFVMFVERRDWMNELMAECLTRHQPVAVWTQDDVPVLRIYRYVAGTT